MRVLLPLLDFPPTRGGIQTMMREFVTRTSVDVKVIAPADEGYEAVDAALPCDVQRVRGLGSSRRAFVPSVFVKTLSVARGWKPGVGFSRYVIIAPAGAERRA